MGKIIAISIKHPTLIEYKSLETAVLWETQQAIINNLFLFQFSRNSMAVFEDNYEELINLFESAIYCKEGEDPRERAVEAHDLLVIKANSTFPPSNFHFTLIFKWIQCNVFGYKAHGMKYKYWLSIEALNF